MKSVIQSFEDFAKKNIMVVGDVMIDRYLFGAVERVSPEAPVPVLHWSKTDNRLGGAANVALNLAALGANPLLCSVIGEDENADLFQSLLPTHGLSADGLVLSTRRQTTVKTRVIAAGQHLLRVDREDTALLDREETVLFEERLRTILDHQSIDLIIFQDYNKGVLSPAIISYLITEANRRGILTAVDPKKEHFWAYKNVSLFKPNLKEVNEALPFTVSPTLSDLKRASAALKERLGNDITLITLSAQGLYIDDGNMSQILPTKSRQIADVCGAGDTVVSIASLGLVSKWDAETIGIMSNIAGGQVCERVGVVPVDRQQLLTEFLEGFQFV